MDIGDPGRWGVLGHQCCVPAGRKLEALWAGVEPAWFLDQCPFPAPPHLLLLPPHLLEILSRLAVSASFFAVPPDPSTRRPWPAHPAPACCNLMGSSWGAPFPWDHLLHPQNSLPGWLSPAQTHSEPGTSQSSLSPRPAHIPVSPGVLPLHRPVPGLVPCPGVCLSTMWWGCWAGR